MNTEPKPPTFIKIVADSTQKKFTLLVILISLIVFGFTYILTKIVSPPIYLEVIGERKCPRNLMNYPSFCHDFYFRDSILWESNVYNLNRTNLLMLLGCKFMIPSKLHTNSFLTRLPIPSQLHCFSFLNKPI